MTIIPVFRDINQPPEPWTAEISDIVREKWFVRIPPHLRKSKPVDEAAQRDRQTSVTNGLYSGAIRAERMKAERDAMAAELRGLLEAGATLTAAAQDMGIAWTRAKKIAIENGIPLPKVYKRSPPAVMAKRSVQVAAMVKAGKTNVEIYKTLGMSRSALEKTLASLGMTNGRKRSGDALAKRNAQILTLRQAGTAIGDIAARFGLDTSTVRKTLKGMQA